jgi:hypothetical protein
VPSTVVVFESSQSLEYKQYIDSVPSHYVIAMSEDPGAGRAMLHSARCMHIRDNKTASLIGSDQVRVVGETPDQLLAWLDSSSRRPRGSLVGCGSCRTKEIVSDLQGPH